jgi:hypothetical protein
MRLVLPCLVLSAHLNATLVVTAPYRNGIIICADKRTYDRVRGDRDTETKVIQIGKFAAFSSTGTPGFVGFPSFNVLWNADTATAEFYAVSRFSPDTIPKLFVSVDASYKAYLNRIPIGWWPESAFEVGNALFQLIFFYLDNAGRFAIEGFQYLYRKGPPPVTRGWLFTSPAQEANGYGNTAIWTELKQGKNKDFEYLRKEMLIRRFLIEKRSVNRTTKASALAFAKRMIVVTSENTAKIENTTYHVSPTCDCAAIEPEKGFHWITKR